MPSITELLESFNPDPSLIFECLRPLIKNPMLRQVAALDYGDSFQEHLAALQAMRDGRARVCVATDVAARGIDVQSISHVFNFDVPEDTEAYIHRVGRAGRLGGAQGRAVTLVTEDERVTGATVGRARCG